MTDEERTAVVDRAKEIITGGKGSVVRIDEWGKKRLSYEIKDSQDGFYYVMYFDATPETLGEVTRVFGITDSVLRFMAVRHEKPFSVQAPAERTEPAEAEESKE